jgi:hypothetical protein
MHSWKEILETGEKFPDPPLSERQQSCREEDVVTLRITLPAGWTPQLPPSVRAASPFGEFRADYTFEGGVLGISRTLRGSRGIYPPDRIGELIAWFREMGDDDAPFILIEPSPAP